jgi:CBS-domain-containing membrane protein
MNRELISLDANLPLEKAYMQLQQHKSDLMPVWSDHRLVGVVDRENMMEFLMVRNALTKPSS